MRDIARQAHTGACRIRIDNLVEGAALSMDAQRRTTEFIAKATKKSDEEKQGAARKAQQQQP